MTSSSTKHRMKGGIFCILWKIVRILSLFLAVAMTRSASSELTVNDFSTTTFSKVSQKFFRSVKSLSNTYHVCPPVVPAPQTWHEYHGVCIQVQDRCSCPQKTHLRFDNASLLESRPYNAFLSRHLPSLLAGASARCKNA